MSKSFIEAAALSATAIVNRIKTGNSGYRTAAAMRHLTYGWSVLAVLALLGAPQGTALAFEPLVEQARLKDPVSPENDSFASSVAISGDGYTALVRDNLYGYVFVRNADGWVQQKKLGPFCPGGLQKTEALSADGNTALIHPGFCSGPPSPAEPVHVYVRTGNAWTLQQKLVTSPAKSEQFVALAANGNTAAFGASGDVTYVFTRSGTTWSVQAILPGTGYTDLALSDSGDTLAQMYFGEVVDLDPSDEGSDIDIDEGDCGEQCWASYVFQRNGSVWTDAETLVDPGDDPQVPSAGNELVLAGDGNTLFVQEEGGGRTVHQFNRSGEEWIYEQALKLNQSAAYNTLVTDGEGQTLLLTDCNDECPLNPSSCRFGKLFQHGLGGWIQMQTPSDPPQPFISA